MAARNQPERPKERLKASYDAMAPAYNSWTKKHSPLRSAYLERLFKSMPLSGGEDENSLLIVEFGCESGVPSLQTILSHYPDARVVGNDMSTTQINLARQNLAQFDSRVELIEGDMTTLSFQDASLDAVVAMYSLIHLSQLEQAEMLVKISKWLKPGGCMLANFATEAMDYAVLEHWLDEKGWMCWSGLGPDETVAKIRETGLEIVHQVTESDDESFLWIIAKKV